MTKVCIPGAQRNVHLVFEAAALLAVAPLLLWAATRERELTRVEKGALAAVAVSTIVVDGWLLYRYART